MSTGADGFALPGNDATTVVTGGPDLFAVHEDIFGTIGDDSGNNERCVHSDICREFGDAECTECGMRLQKRESCEM